MWHVFAVLDQEEPGGWTARSEREVGRFPGFRNDTPSELLEVLRKRGFVAEKYVAVDDLWEVPEGFIGIYFFLTTEACKLSDEKYLLMVIGNGPSGNDWPMLSLEFALS